MGCIARLADGLSFMFLGVAGVFIDSYPLSPPYPVSLALVNLPFCNQIKKYTPLILLRYSPGSPTAE